MSRLLLISVSVLLAACQTQAVKDEPQPVMIEHTQIQPAIDESMATLDMAEFARRY